MVAEITLCVLLWIRMSKVKHVYSVYCIMCECNINFLNKILLDGL